MSNRVLRVVIVGSGMMGWQHAAVLRRIPGLEVVGIADPFACDLPQKAAQLGIYKTYTDYVAMLDELRPDVLHNCTPNSEHFEISREALARGVAVYSEKPLAVTTEQAQTLVQLARERGTPNAVNFNYRSNAMVRELRARMRSGAVGRPLLVHGAYLQDWLMYENDFNWRIDSAKGGASRAVADIGSHWFDTAQLILDRPIEAVYAKLLTVYGTRYKPTATAQTFGGSDGSKGEPVPVDTEDAGFILVRFAGGVFGSLVLSQVSGGYKNALRISVDCAEASMRWEQETPDRITVGDRRNGELNVIAAAGTLSGDANEYTTLPGGHPVGWADALYNNIRLFYTAIRRGTAEEPAQEYATFADSARIMQIVDACLCSNAQDRWIELNESARG
ncbi:MAG: Gfo/Idh/MocA family oxidoreductase [Oscillospiraceae bacterium]